MWKRGNMAESCTTKLYSHLSGSGCKEDLKRYVEILISLKIQILMNATILGTNCPAEEMWINQNEP